MLTPYAVKPAAWLDRVRQAGNAELTVDPAQLPRIRWLASERNSA